MKLIRTLLLALTLFGLIACDNAESIGISSVNYKNLSHPEARELLLKHQGDPNLVILDVRTPEEYDRGHLPNSHLINFYNPNFQGEIAKLDKTKQYLVYCRSGNRSSKAATMMSGMGFGQIMNLTSGVGGGFPIKPSDGTLLAPQQDPMRVKHF